MSAQGFTPGPQIQVPANGTGLRFPRFLWKPARPRYWLHALLFLLTLVTTTAVGSVLVNNFRHNQPAYEAASWLEVFTRLPLHPALLLRGLPFSLTLMGILLAHELGHYFACRYYRVDASLPYFLPAPTPIGTFGAFIRMRSPIYAKQVLFDIGIAGPLAGFAVLLPALGIGLACSKVLPGIANRGELVFGMPPLLWLLEKGIFPGVHASDIYLHPVARAAWVGIFATALNLLPIGQLDGGHILYSFIGERHKLFSRIFAVALLPLGFFYWPWYLWSALLLAFGMRHPSIFDPARLSAGRKRLGVLALAIFLLCFMVAPFSNL